MLEVTLRAECGLEVIRSITRMLPGVVVGAGAVRNTRQLRQAVSARADFIGSSGSSEELLAAALGSRADILPWEAIFELSVASVSGLGVSGER